MARRKSDDGGISPAIVIAGGLGWHELACRGKDGGLWLKLFGTTPKCWIPSTSLPGGGTGGGGQCTTDLECGSGYFCSNGSCVPNPVGTCNKDSDCGGAPWVCVNGTCGIR